MTVRELNEDQMRELKEQMLFHLLDECGESPSYGELANVDVAIPDEEVFSEYEDRDFSEDDFFCSAVFPESEVVA